MAVHVGLAGEEAYADLLRAHLEAEDPHARALLGAVAGYVEGEGALAEAGPGRDHHHVGALQAAAEQLVQVGEPGRYGRQVQVSLQVQRSGLLHVGVEHLPDVDEVARSPAGAHAVEHVLGLPQGGVRVRVSLVAYGRDVAGGRYELPHDGGALHYAAVVLDVDGGGHGAHEVRQVGGAAHVLQGAAQGELVGDGDLVDGLAALEEGHAGLEAQPRPGDVEVAGAQERGDLGQRLAVYEDGAYDGLFRLRVVGK